jgi:hypothetical protein
MTAPAIITFPAIQRDARKATTSTGQPADIIDISRRDTINHAAFDSAAAKLARLPSRCDVETEIADTMAKLRRLLVKRFELSPAELDGAILFAELNVRKRINEIRKKKKWQT